jgi:hypothetical protein
MALDPSVTAALATLRARRDSIDRAISALLALDDGDAHRAVAVASAEPAKNGAGASTKSSSVGGGTGGVLKVLHAFTAAQLAHAMQQIGWFTDSANPRSAARASANRLRNSETEHVFFEEGEFVYRPPSQELEGLQQATQEDGVP